MIRFQDEWPEVATVNGAGQQEVAAWTVAPGSPNVKGTLAIEVDGKTPGENPSFFSDTLTIPFRKVNSVLTVGAPERVLPPEVDAALTGVAVIVGNVGQNVIVALNGVDGQTIRVGTYIRGRGHIFDDNE
jgi:hypothetical protein